MASKKLLKHGVPVRFGTSDTPPDSPENGMIYYDTVENLFKVYENNIWQILSSQNYAHEKHTNLDVKGSCEVATTSNLTATYANGTAGVGATLTGSSALPTIDGVTLSVGQRLLVHKQTSAIQNGIYTVTQTSNPFILTRASDFNQSYEVNGGEYVFIKNGGELYKAGTFVCTNTSPVTFGTTEITFTQTTGPARSMQQHYSVGGQITTTGGTDVIIEGSEKLEVDTTGGMEITNRLSAGQTLVSTASISGSASVGSGKLIIGSDGNITKLNNLTTSFPTSASLSNYALANNGAGTLTFNNLAVSNLNDITLTSVSNQQFLNYNSSASKWVNVSPLSAADLGIPFVQATEVGTLSNLTPGFAWEDAQGTFALNTATPISQIGCASTFRMTSYPGKLKKVGVYIRRGNSTNPALLKVRIYDTNKFSNGGGFGGFIAESEGILTSSIVATASLNVNGYWGVNADDALTEFTFSTGVTLSNNTQYIWVLLPVSGVYESGKHSFVSRRDAGDSLGSNSAQVLARSNSNWATNTLSEILHKLTFVTEIQATLPTISLISPNANGYLGSSFLQYNVNLGNNVISGVASPSASTDLVNKDYADAVSLQTLYNQDADGSGATITTTTTDGALIIGGTEKLQVTATSGLTISGPMQAGSLSAGSLIAGSAGMSVSAVGDLTKIAGVSYNFPENQAAGATYLMVNDGSGNLDWANMNLDQMGEVIVTDPSDFQMIRYDGTNFNNVNTVLSGGTDQILRTNVSGYLASEAVQYPIDFTGHTLTGLESAVGSSDMVSKAYGDNTVETTIGSIDLNSAYHYGPVLTTNSTDGFLAITGSESLKVSASFALADSSDETKFSKVFYKHAITLAANMTSAILNELTFSSALYQGCVIEYRMKDSISGESRVGTLMLSTDGETTSISDTFAETAPMGVTWSATMAESDVQVLYSTNASAKTFSAKIKLFA